MKRSHLTTIVTALVGLTIVVITLPDRWKTALPAFTRAPAFHLGLDLAGGTQLDFRISEDEINAQLTELDALLETSDTPTLRIQKQTIEEQRQNLMEAIRAVLERRMNALGVSEATITPSYMGDEKHLLVECPGVVEVQKCIETVGKTIQLEFKEEFTEGTEEYEQTMRKKAGDAFNRVTKDKATLVLLGEDLGDELDTLYINERPFFRDTLPKGLENLWWQSQSQRAVLREGTISSVRYDPETGTKTEESVPGIFLAETTRPRTLTGRLVTDVSTSLRLLAKKDKNIAYAKHDNRELNALDINVSRALMGLQPGGMRVAPLSDGSTRILFLHALTPEREMVDVSHILVAYKGASGAEARITRTKEEALQKAKTLKKRLESGASFPLLARQESDSSSASKNGSLGAVTHGSVFPAFEAVAFSLPVQQVSDPVETPFGFHLIRVDRAPYRASAFATYEELQVTGKNTLEQANMLFAALRQGIAEQEEAAFLRFLFFSFRPSGWKDTLLDGKHFRSATVVLDSVTNVPVVRIAFDEEGGRLFQELTRRNIQKRIAIFVGGELVSAPTVQQEIAGGVAVITGMRNFDEASKLAGDLNTGAIPAPIHLSGQQTIEASLGMEALQTSLQAALIGVISLLLYMIFVYRLFGIAADITLLCYTLIFAALLKLPLFLVTDAYIVLTLAGMAGIILSIGMAVDANVLIFERIKEELRKGKRLELAIDLGFRHAWPSIRDSNISTLITCAILFGIGTSIVRGFAVTLSTGILISFFSALVITKWILIRIEKFPALQTPFFLGVKNISAEEHSASPLKSKV